MAASSSSTEVVAIPDHVWTILRHLYTYSAPLCEAIQYLRPDVAPADHGCQEVDCLCCKIVVATDKTDLFLPKRSTASASDLGTSHRMFSDVTTRHASPRFSNFFCSLQNSDLYYGSICFQSCLQTLSNRYGSRVLTALLEYCSVFFPMQNGSFIQVKGPPIYNQFQSTLIPVDCSKIRKIGNTKAKTLQTAGVLSAKGKYGSSKVGFVTPSAPTLAQSQPKPAPNHAEPSTSLTPILILSSPEDPDQRGASQQMLVSQAAAEYVAHCSSEELFSSVTTDNSVIIVSNSGHSNPSTTAGEVLSGPPLLAPSLFLSREPFGSKESQIMCGKNQHCAAISTIALKDGVLSESMSSIEPSDMDRVLTGGSPDDDSDHLSNKAYRRKRQRSRITERAHTEPQSKRFKRSHVTEATKRPTNLHKRKKLIRRSKMKRRHSRKRKQALKGKSITSKTSFGQAKFTRTRILYATNLKEVLSKKYVLNSYRATANGARRLVTNIFLDKTKIDPSRIHERRFVNTRPLAKSVNRHSIQRLSPRLQKVVPLLTKLLHNHKHNVRYRYLLEHYCPIPEGLIPTAKGQRSHSSDKPTDVQLPPEAKDGQSIETNKLSKEEELPSLVRAYLDHNQVFKFIRSVLGHLVPPELWGSLHNKLVFYDHLKRFIDLRRWETMNVQQMGEGFKLSHCKWLQLPPTKHRGRPHPPEPRLFERFVLWLIDEVVIRTIKTFFYVTEHADYQNHVFYYRKGVWSHVQKLALQKTSIPYKPVCEDEIQMLFHFNRTLGISKLRFLPKVNGVRPIVNFGSKVKLPYILPGHRQQLLDSVNYQLQDIFHVLNYEKAMRPELFGSTCFGHNNIHARLKKFAMEQRKLNSKHEKPLLFVRVDISNCYDSMLPSKMYDILVKKILSKESYVIRRYTKVFISQNKIRRLFMRVATSKESCESFFKFALKASDSSQSCIFTDQVNYPEIKRSRVTEMLRKHLYGNIVRLGRQHYKQVQGIAQGSKISTMLCGFYYADMEKSCLPKIDSGKELLLRFVDDFFLITRNPEVAKQFLVTMNNGLPEYNCSVNRSKTITNFRLTDEGEIQYQREVRWVEWCGLLVNTRSLEVRVDYSRYSMKNIRDNVTIALHGRHYHYFINFTKRAVRLRCLSLLLDCEVLSEKSVVINMYQGFLIAGVKYLAILTAMPNWTRRPTSRGWRRFTKQEFRFFFRAAVNMFDYFWRQARSRCQGTSGESTFTLSKELCVWLGCHSLKTVLTHHEPKQLSFLIRLLTCKVDSLSNQLAPDLLRRCFSATKRIDSSDIFTVRC